MASVTLTPTMRLRYYCVLHVFDVGRLEPELQQLFIQEDESGKKEVWIPVPLVYEAR